MKKGNKIPYRQGVLTYNVIKNDLTFYVKSGNLFNKTAINITIAAGKNNYYFTIPKDTSLGSVQQNGTIIAYIDCETGWLKFTTISQEYTSLYRASKGAGSYVGEYIYHTNTPRGYVWSGQSWCPRDFVCIATYNNGTASAIPLISQITVTSYEVNIYGAKAAYAPKTNNSGHVIYSIQDGEVYAIEDTGQLYEDTLTILFSDGLACAEAINKNDPICIDSNGMVIKCTANNDFECIGFSAFSVPANGLLYGYTDFGLMSNAGWSLMQDKPVFLDSTGALTQNSNIGLNKYVKQVGTAISKTTIQIGVYPSILINES